MAKEKLNREITEEMFLEELESSLSDYLSADDGEKRVEKRQTKIKKAPIYSAEDIKRIRRKYNFSQQTLANILNVSVRSVENWEILKAKPNGSVYRLLELLEKSDFKEEITEREVVK